MMRTEALRRLDRVDAVLIDPRALSVDDLRVSRIRGSPEDDRAAVWKWAQGQLESGTLTTGWNTVRGAWATNGMVDQACRCWCDGHTIRLLRR